MTHGPRTSGVRRSGWDPCSGSRSSAPPARWERWRGTYVTKPFSTPELLARVRVALRHRRRPETDDSLIVKVGDIEIDIPHHQVTVGGAKVDLTPKEFAFLAALARHPGRVLTHRTLLRQVWGPEYGGESHYLRVYASQLRKKLNDNPPHAHLITEAGGGYRLIDPRSS